MQDEADQCQFIEWMDEPWPERVQAVTPLGVKHAFTS
jgi:hypothetical protein